MAKDLKLETQSLFINAFQNASIGMALVSPEGTLLKLNPSFCQFLGYSEEELLNITFQDITHPDDLEADIRNVNDMLEGRLNSYQMEKRYLHKNGDTIWGGLSVSLVQDERRRKPLYFISQIQDITDRKLAEFRLESFLENNADATWMEKEARIAWKHLNSFIDNHVDAIIMFSKEGRVLRVNQAFENMFGWMAYEVVNKHILDLLYIPDHLKEKETIQILHTIRDGLPINIGETKRITKNGDLIDVMLTGFPMYNNLHEEFNGCWSIVLRDITEWKKSQDILQQSEKLSVAGQLAAGIAHEIRNPITSIKGFLQLMKSGYGQKKEYLDIMTGEIDRIEMILSELLILAKPQGIRYEKADLRELLKNVIALLGAQGNLNNIEIKSEFDLSIPMIECDKNQLKQVFINFIKNSMEAMPDGGKITIEVKREAEAKLRIRFTDQGCGIPENILDKIGQPFFTTKEKGTGLGFMISKKIIEDHNGSLFLTSRVNVGTTIEIIFP